MPGPPASPGWSETAGGDHHGYHNRRTESPDGHGSSSPVVPSFPMDVAAGSGDTREQLTVQEHRPPSLASHGRRTTGSDVVSEGFIAAASGQRNMAVDRIQDSAEAGRRRRDIALGKLRSTRYVLEREWLPLSVHSSSLQYILHVVGQELQNCRLLFI